MARIKQLKSMAKHSWEDLASKTSKQVMARRDALGGDIKKFIDKVEYSFGDIATQVATSVLHRVDEIRGNLTESSRIAKVVEPQLQKLDQKMDQLKSRLENARSKFEPAPLATKSEAEFAQDAEQISVMTAEAVARTMNDTDLMKIDLVQKVKRAKKKVAAAPRKTSKSTKTVTAKTTKKKVTREKASART